MGATMRAMAHFASDGALRGAVTDRTVTDLTRHVCCRPRELLKTKGEGAPSGAVHDPLGAFPSPLLWRTALASTVPILEATRAHMYMPP